MHTFLFVTTMLAAASNPAQNTDRPKPDAVLRWNEVVLKAIKTDRTPPPKAARNLAIVHAAIYDTLNAIERTHRVYRVRARPAGAASLEAAVAVAAHRTLTDLYPRQRETLDAELDAELARVPDGAAKEGGITLGQQVAEKMLEWRANDGANRRVTYEPRIEAGIWRPTPPGKRSALLPQWRYLTPFAIPSTARFMPPTPPGLTSAAYRTALREVKELGGLDSDNRKAEQTLIAWFWDDGEGTVTPPGHWNQIAQTVSRQRGLTLAENARLFALLNVSLADAAILCWEAKFAFSYWRPITALHDADLDGWDSLLVTPPFPSYPSGHSTFSGAAATALARFFGTNAIRFTIGSDDAPGAKRTFKGFWEAAQQAGRSRIYGGIHYEFDNREGLSCGRELADYVARHVLLPLDEDGLTRLKRTPTQRRPISTSNAEQRSAKPVSSGRRR
jgi:hypothetical protein